MIVVIVSSWRKIEWWTVETEDDGVGWLVVADELSVDNRNSQQAPQDHDLDRTSFSQFQHTHSQSEGLRNRNIQKCKVDTNIVGRLVHAYLYLELTPPTNNRIFSIQMLCMLVYTATSCILFQIYDYTMSCIVPQF